MLQFPSILLALLASVDIASAVEVTANSPCSQSCIDSPFLNISDIASSHTTEKDVVCNDWEYTGETSTSVGQKFKACNNCEQYSPAIDTINSENDVYWFLFNLKSTVIWCVFGVFGTTTSSQPSRAYTACNTACQPIAPALIDRLQQTNQNLQYNYCTASNNAFNSGVDTCTKCLYTVPTAQIIGNFLSALKTACVQLPALGKTLSLSTNVFSPPGTSTASTSAAFSTPTSSTTSTNFSSSAPTLPQLSLPKRIQGAAIAGITIGTLAGVVFVALIVFFLSRYLRRGRSTRDPNELIGRAPSGEEMMGHHGQGAQGFMVMPKYELDGRGSRRQIVVERHELS